MILHDLQQQFSQALHYQARGEDCDISATHFAPDELIQIYRNNFVFGLSEVLEATYPMLKALLGDECFEQIARQHVLTNPLLQGDVSDYGEGLEQTLGHFPQVIEQAPYSQEVARFEWHIDSLKTKVRDQAQKLPEYSLDALAGLDENLHGHVQLILDHGISAFESDFALFSLYQAIHSNDFDGLDINTTEQGIVIFDADESLALHQLEPDQFSLVASLQNGATLGDLSQPQLNQLPYLLQLGLVQGFALIDEENT